jgi:uncharacterized protein YcbX
MSDVVGRVAALNRYPVKSMQGHQPDEVTFDASGMVGDRRWALVDAATGKVLSAKRVGALLEASAGNDGTDGGAPTITLPDGRVLEPGDPATDAVLSAWVGREVVLSEADATGGRAYEMSFNVDDEDDGVFEVPTPPHRFVDLCAIHVLTTASLAVMAAAHPEGDWDPNRFRPGVLIATEPGRTGLVEDGWLEAPVTIGEVVVDPVMPTIRCVMTTRPQATRGLERDLAVAKTVAAHNQGNLGLYGAIATPGTIRIGDPVRVG